MKSEHVETVKGDGLDVRRSSNHGALEVIGDGCRVNLAQNSGSVRILGDGCRLTVSRNFGDIEYTGDGGRVVLGPESRQRHVKYFGCGGSVNGVEQQTAGAERPPASKARTGNARRKKTRVVDSVVRSYVFVPDA